MSQSPESPLKFSDLNFLPTDTKIRFNTICDSYCQFKAKYRNIPVTQVADSSKKTPGVYYENASGVKEREIVENNTYFSKKKSILEGIPSTVVPKWPDTSPALNTIQRELYSDQMSHDRMGHGSISEPTLAIVKDRGDSFSLEGMYGDVKLLANKNIDKDKSATPKQQDMKACIYITKSGEIYKSKLETIHLQAGESGLLYGIPKKETTKNLQFLGHNTLKNATINYPNEFEEIKLDNENDDIEITILLTGFKNILDGKYQKQGMLEAKKKTTDHHITQVKKGKKKLNIRKTKGKNYETTRKSFHGPSQMLKIYRNDDGDNSRSTFKENKLEFNFEISSDDSECGYECDYSEDIVKRRPRKASDSISSNMRDSLTPVRSGNLEQTYGSGKNGVGVQRSRFTSQSSSVSHYNEVHRIPKLKISDETLWEKFAAIFRSYASTCRHSGEVIPKKISALWMRNAHVVDKLLTEKEADDAFRDTAATKITMNNQEYKAFLIMLSLRLKLPYYEIYRRMCGM